MPFVVVYEKLVALRQSATYGYNISLRRAIVEMSTVNLRDASGTWRGHLRKTTNDLHRSIEKVWASDDGFRSIGHYQSFLSRILCAHREFGVRAVYALADARPDACTAWSIPDERMRQTAVCRDLGIPVEQNACGSLTGQSYAWGVGYVLNGSAMGASIMLRGGHVKPDWPVEYFQTCQAYVRSGRLKAFFDQMNGAQLDLGEATQGASDVFAVFEDGLGALETPGASH